MSGVWKEQLLSADKGHTISMFHSLYLFGTEITQRLKAENMRNFTERRCAYIQGKLLLRLVHIHGRLQTLGFRYCHHLTAIHIVYCRYICGVKKHYMHIDYTAAYTTA